MSCGKYCINQKGQQGPISVFSEHYYLQGHGLPGQLTEQLLAEENILSSLQLLLPVQLHRLGGGAGQVT